MTWTQLRQLEASGQLQPTDMVWKNGMPSWVAAPTVQNLFPSAPAASSPPALPVMPPPPQTSRPDAPGRVGAIINLLQQANDLWRKLTLTQRIGVVAVAAVVLVLFLVSTITKASGGGDQSKSFWQVLMDLGVVSGAVGLVYGLVQKYLEKKLFSEAPAAFGREGAFDQPAFRQAPKIKSDPVFMGLSAHQWLVTLHIVLLAGMVGTILAGFLFGAVSLLVNGSALIVVGGLIAFLSVRVAMAYEEQLSKEEKSPRKTASVPLWEPHIPHELKMSFVLGLSALGVVCIWFFLVVVIYGVTKGMGDFSSGALATWMYLIYGVAIFLPELHVLAALARWMQPIRKSGGLWISGAYLVAMFALCAVIASIVTSKEAEVAVDVPESVRDAVVGLWSEIEGGAFHTPATIEFRKDGRAYKRDAINESYRYYFTDSKHLKMVNLEKDRSNHDKFSAQLFENEMVVTDRFGRARTFRKMGGQRWR